MSQRNGRAMLTRRALLAGLVGASVAGLGVACGSRGSSSTTSTGSTGPVTALSVVAAENFWGSIAAQLGGDRVMATSLITNPNTDPHDYEPRPSEARMIADARYVILNGAGYDPWMQSLIDANPTSGRMILNIGDLVGKKTGDNPHLWYSPDDVAAVIERITHDLFMLAPADAAFFAQLRTQFTTSDLKAYHDLIETIRQSYRGIPIGSTESIFVYMAASLGLALITPTGFMNAISEGNDITAADKATFDRQIAQKQIKVLIYNTQNATPDTEALKAKAIKADVPIVGITETLDPATDTFQAWQVRQLTDLKNALAKATGR